MAIFMGPHNCLICTLVRLVTSRRSLGVAIILKLVKYWTRDEVHSTGLILSRKKPRKGGIPLHGSSSPFVHTPPPHHWEPHSDQLLVVCYIFKYLGLGKKKRNVNPNFLSNLRAIYVYGSDCNSNYIHIYSITKLNDIKKNKKKSEETRIGVFCMK